MQSNRLPDIKLEIQMLKLRTTKAMPKKASKKAAKKAPTKKDKKKLPRDGSHPNALGLEGQGVAAPEIKELDEALKAYEKIKKARCALTPKEVEAKKGVIAIMEAHSDELRDPKSGNLRYPLDEKRFVEIEPAKVTIKFHEKKAKKEKAPKKDDQTDLEPEQQQAQDLAEQQD